MGVEISFSSSPVVRSVYVTVWVNFCETEEGECICEPYTHRGILYIAAAAKAPHEYKSCNAQLNFPPVTKV